LLFLKNHVIKKIAPTVNAFFKSRILLFFLFSPLLYKYFKHLWYNIQIILLASVLILISMTVSCFLSQTILLSTKKPDVQPYSTLLTCFFVY